MTAPAQLRIESPSAVNRIGATIVSVVMVTGSEGLLRLANFALAIFIARQYSAEALGVFATAVAASTCAMTAADGGLQLSSIRRISADPRETNSVFSKVLVSKLALVPVTALFAAGVLAAAGGVRSVWAVCLLVFARTMLQSFAQMNFAVLKAVRQVGSIAVVQVGHFVLIALALLGSVRWREPLTIVLMSLVICQAAEFAGSAYCLFHSHVRLRRVVLRDCFALVRDSVPTGITVTIATVVLRSDLIFLAFFVAAGQVGQFAAAQMAMVGMYLGAWLFGSILLPQLTTIRVDRAAFAAIVRRWTRVLTFLLLPATAALVWAAPTLLRQIFGAGYEQSARLVAILLLATPFIWLNSLYLHRAIAVDERRIHVRAYAVVTVVAAALSATLAWKWGAMGIAGGAVIREVGLFAVLVTMTVVRP